MNSRSIISITRHRQPTATDSIRHPYHIISNLDIYIRYRQLIYSILEACVVRPATDIVRTNREDNLRQRTLYLLIAGFWLSFVAAIVAWGNLSPADVGNAAAPSTVVVTRRDFSSTVTAIGAVKPQIGA